MTFFILIPTGHHARMQSLRKYLECEKTVCLVAVFTRTKTSICFFPHAFETILFGPAGFYLAPIPTY